MLKLVALALLGAAVYAREETYGEHGERMGYVGQQEGWVGKVHEPWRDMPMSVLRASRLGAKLDVHTRNPPMKPDYLYEEEKDMGTPYNGNWAIYNNPTWAPICNRTFTHIKDQADCGSCWAVSASSVAEDRACIANVGSLKPGFGVIEFSAENLMSCCDWCGNGCEGGYPIDAMRYIQYNGIPSGGKYGSNCGCQPYQIPPCPSSGCSGPIAQTPACSRNCRSGYKFSTVKQDDHYDSDAYMIPSSCTKLQDEIFKRGSIECAFTVHTSFFYYHSGVYSKCDGAIDGGHAVTPCGWGTENGIKYWLIKNSWNASWGLGGYFKMKRCVNLCGIEEQCVAGLAKQNAANLALTC